MGAVVGWPTLGLLLSGGGDTVPTLEGAVGEEGTGVPVPASVVDELDPELGGAPSSGLSEVEVEQPGMVDSVETLVPPGQMVSGAVNRVIAYLSASGLPETDPEIANGACSYKPGRVVKSAAVE